MGMPVRGFVYVIGCSTVGVATGAEGVGDGEGEREGDGLSAAVALQAVSKSTRVSHNTRSIRFMGKPPFNW
jgi:hypothetical protein